MYVKGIQGSKKTIVVYSDNDGNKLVKENGSRSWRNNNPGNIRSGTFANRYGSIGSIERFAIFPDYETGRAALRSLIRGPSYVNLSIYNAIEKYAPIKENNTANYKKLISKLTGLDGNRKISSLNDQELDKLLNAIEKIEGYVKGTEEKIEFKKIDGVKKNKKGVIEGFHIRGKGWITVKQMIALVQMGEVNAVIVKSSRGKIYLRSLPDQSRGNNFSEMA